MYTILGPFYLGPAQPAHYVSVSRHIPLKNPPRSSKRLTSYTQALISATLSHQSTSYLGRQQETKTAQLSVVVAAVAAAPLRSPSLPTEPARSRFKPSFGKISSTYPLSCMQIKNRVMFYPPASPPPFFKVLRGFFLNSKML